MSPADRHQGDLAASAWVRRFAGLVPAGDILDVACGTGRHTRLFLERGHRVIGIDRYNAGVVDLLGREDFELIEANLEADGAFPAGERRFAGVLVTNYLHRPLFPALIAAIQPGGYLIYETFARGNERFGRPNNPDFLLAPDELLDAVRGRLSVVAYEHGVVSAPRPAVIQRICAIFAPEPDYSEARNLEGGE